MKFKPSKLKLWLASIALGVMSAGSYAATPQQAADKLESFLGKFPELGPGYAVVAVTADDVVLDYVKGERNAKTGAKLTNDTPIYIASQTKAYMGMLAAKLDQKGILKLDSKITDHWPEVDFPFGVDAEDYTLADLLNHRVPIEVGVITFLEAYVTELDHQDYPKLIAEHAEKRKEGFQYDNLGFNVYGAILHKATGKSWQSWLKDEIFKPLNMKRTSAKTSDFSLDELAWSHTWVGGEKGWHQVRPKTDEIMQSAGGMVTSSGDMAKWLQLHLKNGNGFKEFDQSLMKSAHTIGAEIDRKKRNSYELPCYGYALGWNVCDFEGSTLYIHGGGYTGARTVMAFSPDLGVGIGVFSNSDNMTGWLTSRTTVQFLQYLVDHEKADKMAEIRQKVYPQRIEKLFKYRTERMAKVKSDSTWGGWKWKPEDAQIKKYLGTYQTEDIPVNVEIKMVNGQLVAQAHSYKVNMYPAVENLFAAHSTPLEPFEAIEFEMDGNGKAESFTWDNREYVRLK